MIKLLTRILKISQKVIYGKLQKLYRNLLSPLLLFVKKEKEIYKQQENQNVILIVNLLVVAKVLVLKLVLPKNSNVIVNLDIWEIFVQLKI